MANFKQKRKIGMYSQETRNLQWKLSWERAILTWKTAWIYKYAGDKTASDASIDDIQNITYFETVDRLYESEPIEVPTFAPQLEEENAMDLSGFGYISPLQNTYDFKFHQRIFEVDFLNRPLIEGDIIEMPFWVQDGNKAYFEITDVNRKGTFEKFFVTVQAKLMDDSRETQDIEDKNSNDEILSDIMDQRDTETEEQVEQSGVDTEDYSVDNDPAREDYDSRNKNQKSFLDDPNSEF